MELSPSTPKTTSIDPTEDARRDLVVRINSQPAARAELESRHGRVWNASELARDYEVLGFGAPFVVVRRRADKQLGSLLFQHWPRYYFAFVEDS